MDDRWVGVMGRRELVARIKIFTAWGHFLDIRDDQKAFERFVGDPELANDYLRGIHHTYQEVSEHTANRIKLLLSPHYRAIVKAWLIKQDLAEVP